MQSRNATSGKRRALTIGLAIGGAVCGLLVAGAGSHDPNGWFGANTAAWMQAVGSIAAILAAVIIDNGASRRLARQQQAELADRHAAVLEAIVSCRAALTTAADGVRGAVLDPAARRALQACVAALDYHLAHTPGLDAPLLAALTLGKARMDEVVGEMRSEGSPKRAAFETAAADLDAIIAQYGSAKA